MAWMMLAAALACFAMAMLLPVGTPLVLLLLLAALLLLLGTTGLLRDRLATVPRAAARMLDEAEMQRLREQIAAQRPTDPDAAA